MKNLIDVLEKLKIDDIVFSNKEFPIDGTVDDMTKFLEENGFNYVTCNEGIDEWFNNYKSKCFYKTDYYLWFADTSKKKISKDNPIFVYRTWNNNFGVYYCGSDGKIIWLVRSAESRKEFLRELNKRFGWQ